METPSVAQAAGTRHRLGLLVALLGAVALAAGLALGAGPWHAAALGAEGAFPVVLVDDEGTEVAIEAEPQRIVSLSPANTEIVFALGAGGRLVGGTDFDDVPTEARDLPDVATFQGVIMEQVVDLEPDLVLAAGNFFTPSDDIARLRELGYPVLVVYAPDVPAVMADIELIGTAIGAADEATAMTAEMSAQIDAIAAAAAGVGSSPRTFYQIGSEPEIYGPAPESFVADMVELAGGQAITTGDPAVFSIPLEELVAADPEVIVVGDANYGVCPADVAARPGWGGMSAVQDGDIRPVDDVPVTRPGPRLAQGLASLARAIHPGLELAGFPPDPALCEAA
jgi:iron complex transport system substrate-binding protein